MLLKQRKVNSVPRIDCLVPIYSDFNCSIETELKLTSNGLELRVLLASTTSIQNFLNTIKKYQGIALEKRLSPYGTSHHWLQYYAQSDSPTSPQSQASSTFQPSPATSPTRLNCANVESRSNPLLSLRERDARSWSTLPDVDALKAVKERWVDDQLKAREKEFTDYKNVTLFAGTWNVNGKLVAEDLATWLLSHRQSNDPSIQEKNPDIYVIGLQELDLSAEAFLLNDSPREDYWSVAIQNGFRDLADKYIKLMSKQLVGMLILVYVQKHLLNVIEDVSADSAGCGIMGMMGNKGGVAIRFRLHDSYLCLVNSHLAADTKEVERRNQDYQEIQRRITFMQASTPNIGKTISVWDCDHLIWIGDLNYRIPLPEADVKEMLKLIPYQMILHHDQLMTERRAGRAFSEFDEGVIDFPPSYKYDPGTNNFDSSEKRRAPSWCDRVVWRKGDATRLLAYSSCPTYITSDHKPVYALFELGIKIIAQEKKHGVHQAILRELDKFENESMPDATISCNSVHFETVKYRKPQSRSIVLANTGQVVAKFRFIPKLDEKHFCRSWLWVNPPMGMVLPGERIKITFTVLVDDNAAEVLNMGSDKLEDILILHLENGKDYFVSISGAYIPTCFAMPLEVLVRLPNPIRESATEISELCDNPMKGKPLLSVPKEIWRVVDYIFRFGLGVDNIFLTSGDPSMMDHIRECLDTGADFPSPTDLLILPDFNIINAEEAGESITAEEKQVIFIHSMAETLIRFLEALPNPVIPHGSLYQRCLDAHQSLDLAKQAINSLSPVQYNLFVYITSFLREVISTHPNQEIAKEKLAVVFSSVLLRSAKPVAEKYSNVITRKKTGFLQHFLSPDTDITGKS